MIETKSIARICLLLFLVPSLNSCVGRAVLRESDSLTKTGSSSVESVNEPPTKSSEKRIWFVKTENGETILAPVFRHLTEKSNIESSLKELLDGPLPDEVKQGFGSEIPRGTILLGVKDLGNSVEIDLSQRFASGGGTTSIETRLQQLAKTMSEAAAGKDVFLNVEGKRLTMTQGEGIEVKQPINN